MGKLENLERQVKELSSEELAAFRKWFIAYDWEVWDRQLEQDVRAGKLDPLAEKALRDHAAGKSTKLWITTPRPTSGRATKACRLKLSGSRTKHTISSSATPGTHHCT